MLRIYLGASPGVGKTYKMLGEARPSQATWHRRRRRDRRDTRAGQTKPAARDLEIIPLKEIEYRGTMLREMDVDAILARVPGSCWSTSTRTPMLPGRRNEKRWQDVEQLLDAGIDVISTLNVQHLESLNDVIFRITGTAQRETVPDEIVRRADQLELVDMTSEAIRRRMAHGNIYPAERIDAALANYFRPGNLDALRELALLWVADRVEDSLQSYLEAHGISSSWETRERVVVGITGVPGGDALIRRAAGWRVGSAAISSVSTSQSTTGSPEMIPSHSRRNDVSSTNWVARCTMSSVTTRPSRSSLSPCVRRRPSSCWAPPGAAVGTR